MRILITNSNGPGGLIGTQLMAAGRDVTFLDHRRIAYLRDRSPLVVRNDNARVEVFSWHIEAGEIMGTYDVIIVAARAHEIEKLAAVLPRAIGAGTVILPLVTGLEHVEALEAACPGTIVFDGQHDLVVLTNADGDAIHTGGTDQILIGTRRPGMSEVAARISAIFAGTRLDVRVVDDVERLRWARITKLAAVCGLAALMGVQVERIGQIDCDHTHLWTLMQECALVAEAGGQPLALGDLAAFMEAMPRTLPALINKVLTDIAAGDLGEITELVRQMNGKARAACLPTPLLDVVTTTLLARQPGVDDDEIEVVPEPPTPTPGAAHVIRFSRRSASRITGGRR